MKYSCLEIEDLVKWARFKMCDWKVDLESVKVFAY